MAIATILPSVSVIVVFYNSETLLHDMLRNLESTRYQGEMELILVDNFSNDKTYEVLKTWLEGTKLDSKVLKGSPDHCLSSAVNRGIENSKNSLILVVNDDVFMPDSKWLTKLVTVLSNHPEISIASPTILGSDELTIQTTGLRGLFHSYYRSPMSGRKYKPDTTEYYEVDSLTGIALIFRREYVAKVGLWDESFSPVLFEDTDFVWRIKNHGGIIAYVPNSYLVHIGGVSFNEEEGFTNQIKLSLFARHSIRSILKNSSLFLLPFEIIQSCFVTLLFGGSKGLSALLDGISWNMNRLSDTLALRLLRK